MNTFLDAHPSAVALLLDNLHDGVVIHRFDTKIVYANAAASRILDLSASELLGKNALDPQWYFVDENKKQLKVEEYPVNRLFASGKNINNLLLGIHLKNNAIRWVNVNATIISNDDGEKTALIIFNDETNRKKAYDEVKLFKQVIEALDVGVVISDPSLLDMPIIYANRFFTTMTSYEQEEVIGRNCRFLQADDYKQENIGIIQKSIKEGKSCNVELRNYTKEGKLFYNLLTLSPLKENEKIKYYVGVQHDITNIVEQEKALYEKNKYIDKYVILSSTDLNGVITEVSQAFCNISGYSKEELIGGKHHILRHPDMSNELYEDMWSSISSGKIWRGEIKNLNKRGESYWVDNIIEPKLNQDKKIIAYTSISQDITDKKTIEEISITDGLTNIYNRRHFNDIFPKVLSAAKRDDKLLCFLMMDIDFFKPYNDNYGHQMGDAVLIKVAKCFKEHLKRVNDRVFRLGGEEFGILFETETQEGALEFAQTLRKKVHDLKIVHEYSSVSDYVTISMGLMCQKASQIKNVDIMYKQADDLLYKSKENGRNRVLTI